MVENHLKWLGSSGIKHGSQQTPGRSSPRAIEQEGINMSKICQVTGKRPISGNNVSHAHNKTKRRFVPNIHDHKFWLESENRFVKLRVSTKGMRIIDKKGIDTIVAELRASGTRV